MTEPMRVQPRSGDYFLVTGATYPFKPTLWKTKTQADRAIAKLRRTLRVRYPRLRTGELAGDCGLVIEPRSPRDMSGHMTLSTLADEYNT